MSRVDRLLTIAVIVAAVMAILHPGLVTAIVLAALLVPWCVYQLIWLRRMKRDLKRLRDEIETTWGPMR